MPLYESVFIARQDINAGQVDTLTEQFSNIVTEAGGKIEKTEYWGLKNLAYRIKKNRKAHSSLMNIDAPSAAVAEMERQMRINEDVIRFMTIKVEEHEEELNRQANGIPLHPEVVDWFQTACQERGVACEVG